MTGTPDKPVRLGSRQTPTGPHEAGFAELSGTLTFPCCGEKWQVTSPKITHVRCPDCGNVYVFVLKFAAEPNAKSLFEAGSFIEITHPFKTKVGATGKDLTPGEQYRVATDVYHTTFIPENHTLIEVVLGRDHVVYATAPNDHLKQVEGSNARPGN